MQAFHPAGAPQLPGFPSPKTYAAPVWRDSTTKEAPWSPITKREATRIYYDMRHFERQTRGTTESPHRWRGRQKRVISKQDGRIGRAGLAVAHALIFDFTNWRTGQCNPSYASIAAKASVSVRTVARCIARFRESKIICVVRRASFGPGNLMQQESNAYGFVSPRQWPGYRKAPDPPPPPGDSWGRTPWQSALDLAADRLRSGAPAAEAQRLLEADPDDPLIAALGRLGRFPRS